MSQVSLSGLLLHVMLCAICDMTNQTTRICKKCQSDPVNAAWQEQPEWELSVPSIEHIKSIAIPNSTEKDFAAIDVTSYDKDILYWSQVRIRQVMEHQPSGKTIEEKVSEVPIREIARRVGCSYTLVRKFMKTHKTALSTLYR